VHRVHRQSKDTGLSKQSYEVQLFEAYRTLIEVTGVLDDLIYNFIAAFFLPFNCEVCEFVKKNKNALFLDHAIVSFISSLHYKAMGKVRNILQIKGTGTFSVQPATTVYQALELMVEKNIGALLVSDQGKFVGIFTERDYARKVILKGKTSKETMIGEIMTENPVTVSPDDSIDDCMKIMVSKYIRHLPVMQQGDLLGLISIGDVVKYIIEEQRYIIEDLEHYITGHYAESI
jgi:CBS domain-containing protein